MSRNTFGNYTLPSGNPVSSGTTITTSWANNTLSDLATEITNSLDRSGRGAMLAPIQVPDGTSAAPSVTFSSDPDTGLYRAGAGDVRMQVDATQTMKWTPTGVTVPVALTASGGATLSGTNTVSGVTTVSGATTFTTQAPVSNVGGAGLILKPASADHVYAEFYADTAAPNTRSGYVGYPNAGGTELTLENQMTGGDLRIAALGSTIIGTQQLKMSGSAPSSSTAITNAVTKTNVVKAWAHLSIDNVGNVTVSGGFNISSASTSTTTLTVTFASAFSSTGFAVFVTPLTPSLVCGAVAASTTTATVTAVNISGGTLPFPAHNWAGGTITQLFVMAIGAQ